MSSSIVARYSTVGEAESARSALEAASIDVEVLDAEMISLNWTYSNLLGGVKLLVRDEDREQAEMVLDTISRDATEDEVPQSVDEPAAEDVDETVRCPECGSTSFTRIPRLALFALVSAIALGAGVAVHEVTMSLSAIVATALILALAPSHRCTACGERWRADDVVDPIIETPPPIPSDTIDDHCPRCGSAEFYFIDYRRLKVASLLPYGAFVVLPVYPFLPKRRCEQCGYQAWW